MNTSKSLILKRHWPVVWLEQRGLVFGNVDAVHPVVAEPEPHHEEEGQRHVRSAVADGREDLIQTVVGEGVVDALVPTRTNLETTVGVQWRLLGKSMRLMQALV